MSPMYNTPTIRTGFDSGVWGDGRHIHVAPPTHRNTHINDNQLLRGVPTISARTMSGPYQNVPFPRHMMADPMPTYKQRPYKERQLSVEEGVDEMRFIAPPKMVFKKPRAAPPPPPSPMGGPHVRQPKSKLDTTGSSDSSNEQTFAYTRDRLLGAVEKV
ncbi:unnamed protein product, partial [Medioppia subpectinata]